MKDERTNLPIIGKIGMATCVTSQAKMPCGYSYITILLVCMVCKIKYMELWITDQCINKDDSIQPNTHEQQMLYL
jgi:hypothetical protein